MKCGLGGLCTVCGLLTAWNSAFGECKAQSFNLPVTVEHGRALLSGEINGQPIKALVDTGAYTSFIWRSETERLGMKVQDWAATARAAGGNVRMQHAVVKQLTLGQLTDTNVDFVVIGQNNPPPALAAMVLGENFFARYSTEFDLRHGAIRLIHAQGCKPEQLVYWSKTFSLAKLSRPVSSHEIRVDVLLNGVPVSASLDSGSVVSLVRTDAAARAGLAPNMPGVTAAGSMTGVGPHAAESWIGTFATFALGDEQIRNANLRIADLFKYDTATSTGSRIAVGDYNLPSMFIGLDFFLSHRILVPQDGRDMVFTYEGGPVFQTIQKESIPASVAAPMQAQSSAEGHTP